MAHIFITGSTEGLGKAMAETLLLAGHRIVVHARNQQRLVAIQDLIGLGATPVMGDLADAQQTRAIADQVNRIGPMHAVIHNAGVYAAPSVLSVNILAPYLLTALIHRPRRLIYTSSSLHFSGHALLDTQDWCNAAGPNAYADSKLFVTALATAIARLWPDVLSNAVDPGWVPTRMGGRNAPDDLRLGHLTQEWLATSNDPDALTSGGYWHHQRRLAPHTAANDEIFQNRLLEKLATITGTAFSH